MRVDLKRDKTSLLKSLVTFSLITPVLLLASCKFADPPIKQVYSFDQDVIDQDLISLDQRQVKNTFKVAATSYATFRRESNLDNQVYDSTLTQKYNQYLLDNLELVISRVEKKSRLDAKPPLATREYQLKRLEEFLKLEGKLLFEVARGKVFVARVKNFQNQLYQIRSRLYRMREAETNIAERVDRIKQLRQQILVATIGYQAAYANNWSLTKESLLYVFGFK